MLDVRMMHCLLLLMSIVTLLFEKLAQFWIILDNLLQLKLTVRWDLSSLRHAISAVLNFAFRWQLWRQLYQEIVSRVTLSRGSSGDATEDYCTFHMYYLYLELFRYIYNTYLRDISIQQNHQNFIRRRYNLFVFSGSKDHRHYRYFWFVLLDMS